MKRMKTFFIYFLIVIGFFAFSVAMEMLYLYVMYVPINEGGVIENSNGIVIEVPKIKATNVNGIMKMKITNNSNEVINGKYVKIELINKQKLIATTKYVELKEIEPNQVVDYKVIFKANNVEGYKVSITNEAEDTESLIIELFGVKVDVNNMIMTAVDTSKRLPDFVYAITGLWFTIKTGKLMWMLYLLV